MGICVYSFSQKPAQKAYEFLDYCHGLGAGGVQCGLGSVDPDYTRRVRGRAEELGMYLELIVELPGQDSAAFEAAVKAAQDAGARCLRAACLSTRRYETFSSREEWERFVADSHAKVARAVPILEKHRMALGLENHKDWTAEELVALLKGYSSEYLGACLDTGNNIALLDDPAEVVERLAPYAVCTHIKDMAVEEYADGFLLSEVPLGEGMLGLRWVVGTIRKARPRANFSLEMITRNPLKIPCRTKKYWATFPECNGEHLARTLARVRAHKPPQPLPSVDGLDAAARKQLEENNVKKCLAYARDTLGLR